MAVYLSEYIFPEARKALESRAEVVSTFDEPEKVEAIILRVFPVDAALMDRLPNLRVIGKHGVGCNTIDLAAAKARGITVVNTPLANAQSVAELIVGEMLDAARNITSAHVRSGDGAFTSIAPKQMTGVELTGKTLGLIGTGNIARRVAKILVNGFGMKVVAYDPYVPRDRMEAMGFVKCDTVAELLPQADFVNVSVPLTPETRDLISGDLFSLFRKDAVLVNAARGGIVNEEGLYEALSTGKLRAAACDAFVSEPPTKANTRLYELPNFVGTPHIGATTEEALQRMGFEVVEDVLNVLAGGEPAHRVV